MGGGVLQDEWECCSLHHEASGIWRYYDYSADHAMSGVEIRFAVVSVVVIIVLINDSPLLLNFRQLLDLAPGTDMERNRESHESGRDVDGGRGSSGERKGRAKRHFQLCTLTSLPPPSSRSAPPLHLLHHSTYASHSLPKPDASSKVLFERADACVCIATGLPRGK
jgi:hypothetical protein